MTLTDLFSLCEKYGLDTHSSNKMTIDGQYWITLNYTEFPSWVDGVFMIVDVSSNIITSIIIYNNIKVNNEGEFYVSERGIIHTNKDKFNKNFIETQIKDIINKYKSLKVQMKLNEIKNDFC